MARIIDSFRGEHYFLSNFYLSEIIYEGLSYETVEHAFQSAKTVQPYEKAWVRNAPGPATAKKRGRSVKLREDWQQIRIQVMLDLLRIKFSDPKLAAKLLATGEAKLVEGNWWGDTFWGVCKGVGNNWLGALLMRVRLELLEERRQAIMATCATCHGEAPAADLNADGNCADCAKNVAAEAATKADDVNAAGIITGDKADDKGKKGK